ncbi:MAG: NADH:ubiquinone reductase (Na(+)-transporting) subunit A [Candidatus Marinimicrobia bacterium]|nr:NADH:ubiquinone reductase (Na(+)-transporting) subunit A [Candidatus Neomarinimicrobiota bacterium]
MHLKITKGHDFNLNHHTADGIADSKEFDKIIMSPLDYPYVKPKLLVKTGEEVKVGTSIFFDKLNPDIKFVSPVSGKVSDIVYGERRVIQSISISNDLKYESLEFAFEESAVVSKEVWANSLKESGLWSLIRQRPFSKIADPEKAPKSVFISLYDTRPYGCDPELVISSNKDLFNKGLKLISKIADCPIHICTDIDFDLDLISIGNQRSCELHTVEGPHPAGNVGVQIHHIDPILEKADTRWYLDANALIDFGYFYENKSYNPYKIISISGATSDLNFQKVVKSQSLESILSDFELNEDNQRIAGGDILSGVERKINDGIGPYDDMVTIIDINKERDFLGWVSPGFKKYSLSNAFLSRILGNPILDFNSRLNGDKRSIISFGRWESVLPMDIMPEALVKSILIEDLESMENLGIYECAEEDFALCSYVCQSKTEVSQIIKKGVELAALDE